MTSQLHAFAFQTGSWRVRHRKLARRLAGCTDWIEFGGTCHAFELLGGAGNVDDFLIFDPAGSYRAATFRRLDAMADQWSIFWADERRDGLDAPMRGRFHDGVGEFRGTEVLANREVHVRFLWTDVLTDEPRWEQAFSLDGEAWEVNWIMHFERDAGDAPARGAIGQ